MNDLSRYRVAPGTDVDLSKWDPGDASLVPGGKEEANERLNVLRVDLRKLQEVMYAQSKHKVLVVFQGMDTAGKDGTIKNVFRDVNPHGISIASFKVPSEEELSHDYLWRVHEHSPAKGRITIFNRSHYEDVLVVRVHGIVSKETCEKRYRHINEFERMLAEEGAVILKFFLHIDLAEQKERFLKRLQNPEKRWKFNPNDVEERKLWPKYMEAYRDAIAATSTEYAPWHIIPSNKKWYRNWLAGAIVTKRLEQLHMTYPEPGNNADEIVIE